MFHHLTLIRLGDATPPEARHAAIVAGRQIGAAIPSVVSMSCGPALHNGDRWDLAFEFAFDDAAGFEAFAGHPAHDDFVERHVRPHADAVMSVDYDDQALPVRHDPPDPP